jgi:hypothetical protein
MNSALCDRVIISSDENRTYLDFWPHVAYAYRTLFPGVQITLVFVTNRPTNDPFIAELVQHGEVVVTPIVPGYPIASQTKMARFATAAYRGKEVCYIDDLDMIPIDRDWHIGKVSTRKSGTMLLVGQEVYGNAYPNQVPVSMMMAEGDVFAQMIGHDPEYTIDMKKQLDYYHVLRANSEHHSNIMLDSFSDEALLVILREQNKVPETHVERGYSTGQNTIDRACWPYNDRILEEGGYLAAHTARPYRNYKSGNDAIIRYIQKRYDGGLLPAPLSEG